MNLNLQEKVYIVSGSSQGIGKAIAQSLLDEGAHVVITGRDSKKLENCQHELVKASKHSRVLAVQGDLNKKQVLNQLKNKVLKRWGHIDGIIANAGAIKQTETWNIPDEDWDWYFEANFKVAYRFVTNFIPYLIKTKGSIVLISSIAGIEEIGAPLPYSAAKSATSMYAKGLARILAKDGVRVNVVNPGNVLFEGGNWDTRLQNDPEATHALIEQNVPMNGFASPEDIAAATMFLLSTQAKFITGSSLAVDGGQTSLFV
jgi:3-oxoacyl-[acyl-carrier protein] reductase